MKNNWTAMVSIIFIQHFRNCGCSLPLLHCFLWFNNLVTWQHWANKTSLQQSVDTLQTWDLNSLQGMASFSSFFALTHKMFLFLLLQGDLLWVIQPHQHRWHEKGRLIMLFFLPRESWCSKTIELLRLMHKVCLKMQKKTQYWHFHSLTSFLQIA